MVTAIDHLVVAVADLDAAAAELTDRLGLSVTAGGRHPDWGTANRIVWLGDAYLELVTVEDAARAATQPFGVALLEALAAGGGYLTCALLEPRLEAVVAVLRAGGSRLGEPQTGQRRRPDGEVVHWATSMPPRLGAHAPFLIRHASTGVEWGAEALEERRRQVHPVGSPVRLRGLDMAAGDPIGLAADLARLTGLEFWSAGPLAVAGIGPHTLRLVPADRQGVIAVVVLAAGVDQPRAVDAFGMRFRLEPAGAPAPA